MHKAAVLSIALAVGMSLTGAAQAQGEADKTQDGGMGNYGAAGSSGTTGGNDANGTSGTTGTVGNYDARTNSDLGTGIIGYHGRRMFGTDNGTDNRGILGTGFGTGNGFMGTRWGDGNHTNNGFFGTGGTGTYGTTGTHTYGTGNNDGGFLGTYGTGTGGYLGTSTGYAADTTATGDGMDWGWLGLLGLLGLAGLRSRNDKDIGSKTRV